MPKVISKDPQFKRVGVKLPKEARKRLKKLAKKHGVDRHTLVAAMIMAAVVD